MTTREWNPGELLEVSGYFWKTCTLHAAVKLDVFTCLGEEQLSSAEVSDRLKASSKGVERLLNKYLGNIIMHHHHLVESWSQLDQCVQSGQAIRERSSFSDEEWRESFLMGMFNMAMNMAPMLIPKIDISSRRHLLDLGGGPGTYAVHFCRHNPQLKATVFDLPTTRPFAEKTIGRVAKKLFKKRLPRWNGVESSSFMNLSSIIPWTAPFSRRFFPSICCWEPIPDRRIQNSSSWTCWPPPAQRTSSVLRSKPPTTPVSSPELFNSKT
jgi:hypothetical protein